ncbi:MAG TPA: polymer-forming cytoskeletal protein, partial [Planctomycetota bacterium]|nr:polymer-forming cytoskeletal protein [Planctomycetota bacterium]
RQRIELLAGCRVMATLVSPKLVIEDGAFFQGECRMGEGATLPPKPTATSTPASAAPPASAGEPPAVRSAGAGGGESGS